MPANQSDRPSMSPVTIRYATEQDIVRFFGDQKPTYTMTAIVGEADGEILGIGGLAHVNKRLFAFCDIKPEGRRYRVAIWKATKKLFMDIRRQNKRIIYTTPDTNEPSALAFLSRIGFQPYTEEVWIWRGDK